MLIKHIMLIKLPYGCPRRLGPAPCPPCSLAVQVVAQYKSYLVNIATHMVSLEQQALQQAQRQELVVSQNGIVGIMIELGSFCERVGMYCPINLKRLFSYNLETLKQPDGVLCSLRAAAWPLHVHVHAGCHAALMLPCCCDARRMLLGCLGLAALHARHATQPLASHLAIWPQSQPGCSWTTPPCLGLPCSGAPGALAQRAGRAQPDRAAELSWTSWRRASG
jgi:hypothetical protein